MRSFYMEQIPTKTYKGMDKSRGKHVSWEQASIDKHTNADDLAGPSSIKLVFRFCPGQTAHPHAETHMKLQAGKSSQSKVGDPDQLFKAYLWIITPPKMHTPMKSWPKLRRKLMLLLCMLPLVYSYTLLDILRISYGDAHTPSTEEGIKTKGSSEGTCQCRSLAMVNIQTNGPVHGINKELA